MRRFRSVVIGASLLIAGCSSPTSESIASSVSGSWELRETVPGGGFWMTLAADGSSISGTGTLLVEAGGGGTATIEGAVVGNVVNLNITYQIERPGGTTTLTRHFAGHLLFDELVGTTQAGDPPNVSSEPTVFIRTN